MADGSLIFDTVIDQSGFKKDVGSIKSLAGQVVKTVGITLSAGAIAKGLISIGKQSVNTASNLQEVQNVVDVTFGEGAGQVDAWAKAASKSYGLSELAAKQYTGTMGAMLKSMGLADGEVLKMSTSLTGLAADFASFYNITSEEAFTKIRAGLSGEIEPLRQLGINMSIANLEAYALSQGIEKSYASMSQAEQAALRYSYLLSVSADAQGDFARTADSLANAIRITSMNVERVGAGIGKELLPAVTRATVAIGGMAGELADAIDTGGIEGGINYIKTEFPLASAAVKGLAVSLAAVKAKSVTSEFQRAQVQLALAAKQGSLAMMAETGVLTVKEHVVGVLTGKVRALTVAQRIYNTVLKTHPVGAAVAAIGALAGAVSLAERAIVKFNPALRETEENALALKHSTEELRDTMANSAASYRKTQDDIEGNAIAADRMIDRLTELSAAYTGTKAEQSLMQAICDQLNSSVEGLNISFDAQTGALSNTAAEMKEYTAAAAETAKVNAATKRYTELLVEQSEAQYKAKTASEKYYAILNDSSGYTLKAQRDIGTAFRVSGKALAEVNAELAYQEGYLASLGIQVTGNTQDVGENTGALEENAEAQRKVIIGGYDLTQVLQRSGVSAEEASERFDSYSGAAQNMFELISTESELSLGEWIANLDANAAAVAAYGENLKTIAGKIPDDLYAALAGNPEKFAGIVSEMAAASPDDLAALSRSWANAGEQAGDALLKSLGAVEADEAELPTEKMAVAMENDTSLEDAAKEKVTAAAAAMTAGVQTAGFQQIGSFAIRGFINGMLAQRGAALAAARSIGSASAKALKESLDENSPSKLTEGFGEFFTLGYARGILKKLGIARSAAERVAEASAGGLETSGAYPMTYQGTQAAPQAVQAGAAGRVTKVTQNIYAEKQTPAEMLREARWMQERAVLIGV